MWVEEYLYSKGPIEGSVHLCMYLFLIQIVKLARVCPSGQVKGCPKQQVNVLFGPCQTTA